jgi:hypothetical protein
MTAKTPNGLSDISLAIGGLQADVRNIAANVGRLANSFDENKTEVKKDLATYNKNLADKLDPLVNLPEDVKNLKADAADYRSFKNRIYGIAIALGAGGEQAGHWLVRWLGG